MAVKATYLPPAVSASLFIPARSSKHRHAALALCRALLRQARRIPLSKDVWPTAPTSHPVKELVVQQFRRNKGDTAPRLVFAALTAGYKFLSLFKQAQDPSSSSYAEVTSYIQTRPNSTQVRKKKPTQPVPHPPPLLLQETSPDGSVAYYPNPENRPVPFEALREGRRHIPQLMVTSEGYPFLRLKKPQPERVHGAARRHKEVIQARATLFQTLKFDDTDSAREEDQWDRLVEKLRAQEGGEPRGQRGEAAQESTYEKSVYVGTTFLYNQIAETRTRMAARTQGMMRLIEEEQRLYREETPRRLAAKLEAAKLQPLKQTPADASSPAGTTPHAPRSPREGLRETPEAPPAESTAKSSPKPRGKPRRTPVDALSATSTGNAAPRRRGRPRKTQDTSGR